MGFMDEYYKALEDEGVKMPSTSSGGSSSGGFMEEYNKAIGATSPTKTSIFNRGIAPISDSVFTRMTVSRKNEEEKKKRKWFEKGLFEDGYDFGDISRTILGTTSDVLENLGSGIIGMGEKAVDALAYIAPYAENAQFYQNGGGYNPELQKQHEKVVEQSKKDLGKFIAKDLYDEEKVARVIISDPLRKAGIDSEAHSVFGEKSDALIQSGGQLLATAGLSAAGMPWWLTTGVTSFGGEAENAMNQDASYEAAGASAAISAGAEILSEKLSGGISFGGKSLDDALTKQLARGISNKLGRTAAKLGLDMVGEGSEEVFSQIASNLGSSLYKEEDITELLFNEEAMDGYLESFIGGAALGGVSNAYNAVKSNSKGVDYTSGLTQNEQKVVDKLYQDEIASREKESKVTQKEKAEIYDRILNDMDKGYISIDTIEEVLGGEKYSQYKQTAEWEDSLQTEFDTLNKMKQGDMTGEQVDRREALRTQIQNVKATSSQSQLRSQIRDEVMGLVKGDRLAESYNERVRTGQKFEADVTQYDTKQQAVVQKAIDSGILNNSNRTHEFVDFVSKISADTGVLFDFSNTAKIREAGFAVEGQTVDGFITKDGITVNIDSPKSRQFVVGHEITHALEGTELYDALRKSVFDYAKMKNQYGVRMESIQKRYKEGTDFEAELTADLVGEYIFSDTDFINNLSTQNRNVFQKVFDEIKYLCKVATAGSKEARELEKVKRAFEKAYREGGKTQGETKYSVSDSEGVELSKEQQEFFKDSVVRDENGNLKRMYHGTANGGHTVFDTYGKSNYGLFGQGAYFTEDPEVALSYTKKGKTKPGKTPEIYEAYLNIKNPMDMDTEADPAEWAKAFPDATFPESGTNESFYRAMEEYFADMMYPKWEAAEEAMESIRGMGYDGITHIGGGRFNKADTNRHRVYIAFDSEQIKNFDNKKPTDNPDIRYSLSDSNGKQLTKEQNEHGLNREEEVSFSLSNDTAYMDKAIAMNASSIRVDSKALAETKALRERIAGRMNDIKDRGLVGLPEDIEGNTYIANSSYDGTEENTTICPRSLASEAFVDAVSEYLGRPLSVNEQIYISQDLQGRSLTPECTYCYVATDRKAYRAFLGEYVAQRDAVLKDYESGNWDTKTYSEEQIKKMSAEQKGNSLYVKFLNGRKPTTNMASRFSMWIKAAQNGKPMIDASHLANINKLMGDINSEFGAELKPQIVDAMKYAQSASWAKKRVNYVAYNGHILKWKQDRINKLNSHYGLRMYSFSDFHPAFVLENMQMITDASVRGLKMLGYTKDTDFVDIFAPSGMNINVSTFGFEAGGEVFENNLIGAEWEKAKALREQYPNVGITFVATNDTLVNWALDQDWIDVVIPYHLVRTGAEVAKAFNYTNYTSESSDTKTKDWKKGDKKYIAPTEHNNDKATYLAALENNHLKPRFERFLENPNYMKLVNECRQPASVSKPVQPVFNEDAAMVALAKLEANGYYQPIGGSVDRMYEIAGEVAEAMTKELAPAMSLSNVGEQHTADSLSALRLQTDDIAPVAENTTTAPTVAKKETVAEAPVTADDLSALFPNNAVPVQEELEQLVYERDQLYNALEVAVDRGSASEVGKLSEEYQALSDRIKALESEEAVRTGSITDADAPEEMDAPYQPSDEDYEGTPETVDDPFEQRDIGEVGKQSVKAYQYENPEVKPFFQEAALGMLYDVRNTTKGEKWYNDELYYATGGEQGFGGTKRRTTDDIAELKDVYGYTYDQIEAGLNAIIEDDGAENNAVSKRIEFMLNDRLLNGYRDIDGRPYEPNQGYIKLLNEKQITEYSREAFDQFMANADLYAPSLEESYAPILNSDPRYEQTAPVYDLPGGQQTYVPTKATYDAAPTDDIAPLYDATGKKGVPDGQQAFMPDAGVEKKQTRKEYHQSIIDNIKDRFDEKGFDFDKVLKSAKNLSTWSTVDNTPQRVMEKALGYKEGGILADMTVNKVAQNETEGIKWLNAYVDQLKQISKQYGIKPGSKESAAAQMFAEGFYVNENNEIIRYGEPELIQDFGNADVRRRIKGLARDPRIRKIYDDTLANINESRARNLYPEIPRLDNYFLHFRAMEDTFSTLGLPFNPNDIRAKDLPTDLNGVTADLKPGQPYFASANHRIGKRTSFDLLGGVERYLNSAKNQIYHIDDIQTLRALRNYIAETYGQATGLEDIDSMTDAEAEERIKQVYDSHLSTFAKFLNEEANVLAGKTALIDRGIEGIIGRRGITFLNALNKQVGSNMVGYNVSSSLTNFLPVAQTFAKTNKFDFTKAFVQTVANKLTGGRLDSFAEDSPVVIRRKGEDRFAKTFWQKRADPGYALMGLVDDISTEIIARTKYNEFTRKGMDSQKAHFETDKWVSKLMGDRSLGQQPQLYNSKMLGLFTKFQLEVRNQLDSQFYDTIQETKVSNEHIQNGLARNAKTAAKVTSVFAQLAVAQHLYGMAFESIAGYNPAFDIIEVLMTAFGYDDEEDSEDTLKDNLGQGFEALMEDLPYASIITGGGRIPISSALPIKEFFKGEDQYGNEKNRWETLGEVAPYYLMPGGYGQLKKTTQGLKMFSDDHPIAGSYTDAGNLRYDVEDTVGSRIKAGIFGQYASENAQKYFDQEQRTLNPEQTEIFAGLDIPIEEYWEYRDNLYEFYDVRDALKEAAFADDATDEDVLRYTYINNVYGNVYDMYDQQKELASGKNKTELRNLQKQMEQMLSESKYAVDSMKLSGAYGEVGDKRYNKDPDSGRWYEIKPKNADGSDNWYYQKEQEVTKGLGISYEEYWNNREEYNYAYDKPGRYAIAQAVGGYDSYREYYDALENWQSDYYIGADKDAQGNSISGSRKKKVLDYINGLDLDYGERIILYRTVYSSKTDKRTYNQQIIDYLNERDDISYAEMKSILEELEMVVDSNGYITW